VKIIKHEHSCTEISLGGKTLLIDPGTYTPPLTEVRDVVAIVMTHEHPDHCSPDQLDTLLANNPGARIFAPAGVVAKLDGYAVEEVQAGDQRTVEGFEMRLYGGSHAVTHKTVPVCDNVGILVNERFYYTGDSFSVPHDVPIDTLAVTAGAPWLKIADVIDFIEAVKPKRAFPTHELVLSEAGIRLHYLHIKNATERAGGQFFPLKPKESIEI
jgi:L-ascorbate metabolism protein UlaG (beta-lactamase superfamily)